MFITTSLLQPPPPPSTGFIKKVFKNLLKAKLTKMRGKQNETYVSNKIEVSHLNTARASSMRRQKKKSFSHHRSIRLKIISGVLRSPFGASTVGAVGGASTTTSASISVSFFTCTIMFSISPVL